jgi:hypothetical protein
MVLLAAGLVAERGLRLADAAAHRRGLDGTLASIKVGSPDVPCPVLANLT